jgi:hypothetical protein
MGWMKCFADACCVTLGRIQPKQQAHFDGMSADAPTWMVHKICTGLALPIRRRIIICYLSLPLVVWALSLVPLAMYPMIVLVILHCFKLHFW